MHAASYCCLLCTLLQGQDWDFIAHTFWLKHGVAMLFDSLYLAEGITLAYNSGKLELRDEVFACCQPPELHLHTLAVAHNFPGRISFHTVFFSAAFVFV